MKRKLLFTYFLFGFSMILTAQIKIGDNPQTIDAASVLELESTDRVLVITRVSTAQMNAIVPNQGAMVYNTDEQCVFYYDGSIWQNLCAGQGLTLTSDPIVNPYQTITITSNGDERNIEVTEIRGDVITDGSIEGIDIQDNSITASDLDSNSVGSDELQNNSITDNEMDYGQVTLGDFVNDVGYLTSATIVSTDTGNNLTTGTDGGAYFNAEAFEIAIQANTDAIAADMDGDATNELQAITSPDASVTVNQVGNDYELTVAGGGTDDQNIQGSVLTGETLTIGIENGASENVDLSIFATDADLAASDAADLDKDDTNEIQTISSPDASVTVNQVGNDYELTVAGGGTDDQNIQGSVLTGETLTIGIENGTSENVDLSIFATDADLAASDAADLDKDDTNEIQDLASVLVQGADAGASLISNVLDPVAAQDVATKAYVDANGGGTIVSADTPNSIIAGTDGGALYDDPDADATNEIQDLTSVLVQGTDAGASLISNVLDPVAAQDVATKAYVDTNGGGHTGTTGSVFFADSATGAPTEDNDSFYWDETARFGSGALFVGIDANIASTKAKVHIMEDRDVELVYPLQLQNASGLDGGGAGVGILFSVEGLGSFGKGAIAYERIDSFGRGDFHILQESTPNMNDPELINAVVTVKNNGNVGIGSTTPNSTLETNGSFAAKIRQAPTGVINDDDHTVIFIAAVAVTLPPANTSTGRIYVLKNTTGAALVIDNYLDSQGFTANSLPAGVTWLQSDGVNWQQVN